MKINNEAELLNMFCDKNIEQEILHEPFYNTNFNEVWSSNGSVLIRVNPKVLANEYTKKRLHSPVLECPCKKIITIEAINNALNECPLVDEEIIIQDTIKCEECDGSGEVYWEYTDNHGHTHDCLYDCPICDGTGEIEHKKTKKTGKQIIKENSKINIGNAYFFAYNISKLKFAMDFLGITSVELAFNPHKNANEFVIDEDIRIEIMPIYSYDDLPCDAKVNLED